jgi:outer membrane protein assembly factor BamD (BamD/ComL family)
MDHQRALQTLADRFAGTAVAEEVRQALDQLVQAQQVELAQRQRLAAELLAAAQVDFEQQNWLACLERCDRLLRDFEDLPQAKQAQALITQLQAHPEHMQRACDRLAERLGELQLALAESWLRQGEPQLAIAAYRKVLGMFPGTRYAEVARARLHQLTENPFHQTQFSP